MAETEDLHREAFNDAFRYFGLEWVWDIECYRHLLRVAGGKERIRHFMLQSRSVGGRRLFDEEIVELHRFKTVRYASLLAARGHGLRPGVSDLTKQFISIFTLQAA